MSRYVVTYEGFLYVESDNADDAWQLGEEILSAALPQDFHGGDWEIWEASKKEVEDA